VRAKKLMKGIPASEKFQVEHGVIDYHRNQRKGRAASKRSTGVASKRGCPEFCGTETCRESKTEFAGSRKDGKKELAQGERKN